MTDSGKKTFSLSGLKISFMDQLRQYDRDCKDITKSPAFLNQKLQHLKEIAKASLENGDSLEAMYWYGHNLVTGEYKFEKEIDEGIKILERTADKGNNASKETLGDIHCGFISSSSKHLRYSRGLRYFRSANTGYAHFRLAECYFKGHCVAKDERLGEEHLEKSAQHLGSQHGKFLWAKRQYDRAKSPEDKRIAMDLVRKSLKSRYENLRREAQEFIDLHSTQAARGCSTKQKPKVFNEKQNTVKSVKTITHKQDLDNILKPFDAYVGFEMVKEKIREMAYMYLANQKRREKGLKEVEVPSMHMVFKGNPGTGKTVVARLFGDILRDIGYLPSGHVVEVDRGKLVGRYVGHSEEMVQKVLESAQGGVLFIDEAYELDQGFQWDFGNIVTTILLKAMEDYREDMVIIMAGYPHKMERFLDSNPGLRSRMATVMVFPDYTDAQMVEIFEKYCSNADYTLASLARQKLKLLFKYMKPGKKDKFGNARGVRNLFEDTLRRQARRIIENGIEDADALSEILPQDLPGEVKPPGDGKITYLFDKQ